MNVIAFKERAPDYLNLDGLSKLTGLSKRTIQRRLDEIREENERYGDHAVIRDGNITLVNYAAFIDFLRFRGALKEKNARKLVPEFNPGLIKKMIGD